MTSLRLILPRLFAGVLATWIPAGLRAQSPALGLAFDPGKFRRRSGRAPMEVRRYQ